MRFFWTAIALFVAISGSAQDYVWSGKLTAPENKTTANDCPYGQTASGDFGWTNLPVIHRPEFRRDTFSILRYGAVADGITLNTKAINSAIEDCSRKGGG